MSKTIKKKKILSLLTMALESKMLRITVDSTYKEMCGKGCYKSPKSNVNTCKWTFSQILIKCPSVYCPLNSHTPETDQRSVNQWFIIPKPSKNNSYLSIMVQQLRHIKNINLTMSANTMTVWGTENTFINTEYTDSVFSQTFFQSNVQYIHYS